MQGLGASKAYFPVIYGIYIRMYYTHRTCKGSVIYIALALERFAAISIKASVPLAFLEDFDGDNLFEL